MLQYSVYSVISPEGCASILFRDAKRAEEATKNLKITAKDVVNLGCADEIVQEPPGGAHNNWETTANSMKKDILKHLKVTLAKDIDTLLKDRYQKFRLMGTNLG